MKYFMNLCLFCGKEESKNGCGKCNKCKEDQEIVDLLLKEVESTEVKSM